MHDIDRTQLEYRPEPTGIEAKPSHDAEWQAEGDLPLLGEDEEMALATELLGVADEGELDRYLGGALLGKLLQRLRRRGWQRRHVGALRGALKAAARRALPLAPSAPGALGVQLAAGVASAALPEQGAADEAGEFEDLELEGARRFVRLAADAARKIANAEASDDPRSGAGVAVLAGAKRLAPGLTETTEPSRATLVSLAPQSGRWVRRGNVIVLLGL